MNRRTKIQRGCVNFPVDNPNFKSTGEGGMFVQLVVWDNNRGDWPVCCGLPNTKISMSESLLGPPEIEHCHFPYVSDQNLDEFHAYMRYDSIPYLAVISLGSTGWSGWDEANGEYWQCKKSDLTEEGKKLYDSVEMLYPGAHLTLLTWLDT